MQQTLNGGNKNVKEPPKEMSMEVRLLLAFLLMGAVMFVTPYLPFFKSATPPPGAPPDANAAAAGGQPPAPPATQPDATPPAVTAETASTASAGASTAATKQESLPL